MGRTNGTYRLRVQQFEEEWQPFRRALRARYQDDFDQLFEKAELFANAAGMQNPVHAYRTILFSIILAQEVERRELKERTATLEERVAALEDETGDAV